MWMSCHFFVPLAMPEALGHFGSGQEYELSAMLRSSKSETASSATSLSKLPVKP
jgi:hypothetical protein